MALTVLCAETAAEQRRPARQSFTTARVASNVNPVLGFCLKTISLALSDAGHTRRGEPTEDAISAVEWIKSDELRPGTFTWACHWLGLNPEQIRLNGLPHGSNVVHQYRGQWEETRIRFRIGMGPSIVQRRHGGAFPRSDAVP